MATTATPPIVRDTHYVGGEWLRPLGTQTATVVNATTEAPLATVTLGTAEDVDRAVAAARAAFETWSTTPLEVRAQLCAAIAAGLEARGDEIAATITAEMGMPIVQSRMIQAGLPINQFASMPALLEDVAWEEETGNSLIVREPVGVVGAITPWNYPLHQVAAKVAPAIAAGCTVVLKPSEITPLSAFILAEVCDAAGLPAGVLNLVPGTGPEVGEAIAAHPGIDMVSFTGSTRAGRRVAEVAAATVKRVALELGGKSANVILDGADLMRAVPDAVGKCYLNSGQTCSALTRLVVPREHLGTVEAIAAATAEHYAPGDPMDQATPLGPVASAAQRDRVREWIARGVDEGARLLVGGVEPPEGLETGWYVQPTILTDVTPDMAVAQQEIFGPVLSIIPYDGGEDVAVAIANDSDYGLAGGVWAADDETAIRVARRIRTGQIEINGGAFNPLAPFGGFKQSGHGRENGRFGLEEYLAVKSLQR
jgi:acyl-CoA reductase-like NAD-dependent aldehyde dehydrogenase